MSIVLSPDREDRVRRKAAEAGVTPEEYLSRLVDEDNEDTMVDVFGWTSEESSELACELEARLGDPHPGYEPTPEFWEGIKREALERLARGE